MLAACGPATSSQNATTLTVVTDEDDPKTVAAMEAQFAAFATNNPGYTAQGTFIGGDDAEKRLAQLLGAGEPPTIWKADATEVARLAATGQVEPVTDVVSKLGNIDQAARLIIDGEDYIVPSDLGCWMMLYRKDLFDAKGLKAPRTWDQFAEVLEALSGTDVFPNIFVTNVNSGGYIADEAQNYFWSNGATFWGVDGEEWIVTLDGEDNIPRGVAALEFFKTRAKYSPDSGNYNGGDVIQGYLAGKAAVIEYNGGRPLVNATADAPDIAANTGVAPIVHGSATALRSVAAGYCLIKKEGRDHQPGKDLLESLVTGPLYLDYLWSVPGHLIPPYPELREGGWATNKFFTDHPDLLDTIKTTLPNSFDPMRGGPPSNYDMSSPALEAGAVLRTDTYGVMIDNVVNQGLDPEEAIKQAADGMRKVQAELK